MLYEEDKMQWDEYKSFLVTSLWCCIQLINGATSRLTEVFDRNALSLVLLLPAVEILSISSDSFTALPSFAGDLSKFGRGDASSPAPATTLAQTQQNQTQTHHTTQQTFLNPALPPGYSYTSLPYYTGMPGLPNTFQYGPAVFPVRTPFTSLSPFWFQ